MKACRGEKNKTERERKKHLILVYLNSHERISLMFKVRNMYWGVFEREVVERTSSPLYSERPLRVPYGQHCLSC